MSDFNLDILAGTLASAIELEDSAERALWYAETSAAMGDTLERDRLLDVALDDSLRAGALRVRARAMVRGAMPLRAQVWQDVAYAA